MQPNPSSPEYAALDRAGVDRTAFYPRPDRRPPPPGASDHRIEVEPGVGVWARLYGHDAAYPTLLYFHGNGEVASDHDDIANFYREIGTNLLVVEFRGYGGSDGRPTFATLVADARVAAARALESFDARGFTAPRFVMGRSMGAHSALEIAANAASGFNGVILESGAGSIRRIADRFPMDAAEAERLVAAHEAKIRSIRLPVLMIHGERDELIPLERAVEIYDLLEKTERELVVIPRAGHNDILWVGQPRYFGAIRDFVDRFGSTAPV